jgi:hypothetical protein
MTTSTASRRLRSTLVELRGPPRTQAQQPRMGIWFHPTRTALRPPLGHSADAPSLRPKPSGGPPWPSALLQSSITGTPRRPAGYPASQTTLPLLGFVGPTTQYQTGGPVRPRRIPPPQRAAYGVWLPPARTSPPALPTLARWSAHGLHPSRCSPRCDRCPSRGPCLPDVTHRATPPERDGSAWPPSRPCSRNEFVLSPEPQGFRPSIPSWGSSFQSSLPSSLALALIAAPPLSPSDGFTFRPARASGYRGVNEWNGPSPDRRLS